MCKLHTLEIEPENSIILNRWPTLCTTKDKWLLSTSQHNFLYWDVLGLFVFIQLKCWQQSKCWWDFLKWIWIFCVIHIWLKHFLLSRGALLCLPSLSVALHRCQPLSRFFAVEEQSIIFRLDCSNLNFENSQQCNCITENSRKHYGNMNYMLHDFGEVWTKSWQNKKKSLIQRYLP